MTYNSRFGSRYGGKVRKNVYAVEAEYKFIKQDCPFCGKKAVKRKAAGVFVCGNCNKKFAGGAYKTETRSKDLIKKQFDKFGKPVMQR